MSRQHPFSFLLLFLSNVMDYFLITPKIITQILICRTKTKEQRACSTYINFRFLSASRAETTESNTFCTQAPCIEKRQRSKPYFTIISHEESEKKQNLDGVIRANIILINRLQPSYIVMRMRDQVNIKLPRNNTLRGIIHHELRFSAKNHR